MVTYKQIGLKHSLSRAYVCIYIDWLCIDIFIFYLYPWHPVKWWYSWEEANSLEFLVGCLTSMALRLHPSFQKLWKFWRCKFVPFQYFFWGYFWGSISATTRQRKVANSSSWRRSGNVAFPASDDLDCLGGCYHRQIQASNIPTLNTEWSLNSGHGSLLK